MMRRCQVFTDISAVGLAVAAAAAWSGHACAAAHSAGDVTEARVTAETPGDNWLVKGGSFAQQQFSPLKEINDKNVAHLGVAWITEMDDPMGLAAEPIVVDGVIYISAPRSIVRAIGAADGKILWTFDPHVRLDFSMGNSSVARVNRGVAVWEGKIYVGTADGRLVAIDAAKGTQLWSSQVVDPTLNGISGAPRVGNGRVFIGYSGSDEQVRGSIAAFDANSGKEMWRFWTVPGDPALGFENKAVEMAAKTWTGKEWWRQGGGSVWDPITYDARTGLLLFGTSKAFRGGGSDGQEMGGGAKLFSGSIVAVHADSGEYAWHYQTSTPERQTENFHIVLADLTIDGRARHVAMSAARNGTFYVLDAATGALIGQRPLVKQEWIGPAHGLPGRRCQWRGRLQGQLFRSPKLVADELQPDHRVDLHSHHGPAENSGAEPRRAAHGGTSPGLGSEKAGGALERRASAHHQQRRAVDSGQSRVPWSGHRRVRGVRGGHGQEAMVRGNRIGRQCGARELQVSWRTVRHRARGWGGAFRLWSPSTMMVTPRSKYGPSRLLAFKLAASGHSRCRKFRFPRCRVRPSRPSLLRKSKAVRYSPTPTIARIAIRRNSTARGAGC